MSEVPLYDVVDLGFEYVRTGSWVGLPQGQKAPRVEP